MYNRSKVLVVALIICMFGVAIFPQPTRGTKFIISSISNHPDEYGQGLYGFAFKENSTGSWVHIGSASSRFEGPTFVYYNGTWVLNGNYHESPNPSIIDLPANVSIQLLVYTLVNMTLIDAVDENEAQNFMRHNVTVTNLDTGGVVFSQQNFTYSAYSSGSPPEIWMFVYTVVLNFITTINISYSVTVYHDLYWSEY